MTNLFIPEHVKGNKISAEAIKQDGKAGEEARKRLAEEALKAKTIPAPAGYRILVAIPESDKTFDSGIVKADVTRQYEEIMTTIGLVVKMGPDCYKDPVKFPSGPWCKEGDFVVMRAYSGTRIKIFSKEWRLINDDTVEAVVEDPRGISRV